jgi:AcrR family transcriptional regulator
MSRPRSEDKRQTILQAAARLFAEEGLSAPTARIAKMAGVVEGTVFVSTCAQRG